MRFPPFTTEKKGYSWPYVPLEGSGTYGWLVMLGVLQIFAPVSI